LTRALDVMVTQNERRSLAQADFKISIDMKGFTVGAYDRVDEFIALGYKTAASLSDGLKHYAIQDPAEWQKYLDERNARKRPAIKKVDAIVVTGTDSDTGRRIEKELAKQTAGPLDFHSLDTQLTRIAGRGEFDDLGYEGFVQNGVPSLRVTAHEKT